LVARKRLPSFTVLLHCLAPRPAEADYLEIDTALIFRDDGTPHFPELPGFPYRKHLPDETMPAQRPRIADVLAGAASGWP
jgi:hypothetical protein